MLCVPPDADVRTPGRETRLRLALAALTVGVWALACLVLPGAHLADHHAGDHVHLPNGAIVWRPAATRAERLPIPALTRPLSEDHGDGGIAHLGLLYTGAPLAIGLDPGAPVALGLRVPAFVLAIPRGFAGAKLARGPPTA